MAEKSTPVDVARIDYVCDKCGIGSMVWRNCGVMLESHPARYSHECSHCGACQLFYCTYPRTEYRDKA